MHIERRRGTYPTAIISGIRTPWWMVVIHSCNSWYYWRRGTYPTAIISGITAVDNNHSSRGSSGFLPFTFQVPRNTLHWLRMLWLEWRGNGDLGLLDWFDCSKFGLSIFHLTSNPHFLDRHKLWRIIFSAIRLLCEGHQWIFSLIPWSEK